MKYEYATVKMLDPETGKEFVGLVPAKITVDQVERLMARLP